MSKKAILKVIKSYLEYEIRDKHGRLIEKKKLKSRTWTKNFMELMRVLFGESTSELVDTSGNPHGVSPSDLGSITAKAPEGNDSYGVLVGSSNTAPDKTSYALNSKISHGDGSGQLHYMETSVSVVSLGDGEMDVYVSRDFKNNSGADINIGEVGLAVKLTLGGADNYFLIYHSALSSLVTVPADATITWKVHLKHTFVATETV